MPWTNGQMHWGTHANERTEQCRVRIDGTRIVLVYEGEDTPEERYEGEEEGPGHFRLRKVGGGGSGSLHRLQDDDELEGSWAQGGEVGYWRVRLLE